VTYRIREVDTTDDEITDTLVDLHRMTFFDTAPIPAFDQGHWWIGYLGKEPVSFAALVESDRYPFTGYFKRVGVLDGHRGHGLQQRHMRVMEARAKRNGWIALVSDTTDNVPSANNFVAAQWRMFTPDFPWSLPTSLYWKKSL
jgi:GNAT superfamily N-acetyltransferase